MNINDVVTLAKYSELSGVAVKNDLAAIVAFINLGLIEIHKRFPIKVKEHMVHLANNVTLYEMPDDLMYALSAFDEVDENAEGEPNTIPINDEDDEKSIFFNDWNSVQVPSPISGAHISIIYVAKPETITLADAEEGTVEVDLPDVLIDALLSYIGYRAHMGITGNVQGENNAHWARFERSCNKARELGVAFPADSMNMTERLSGRGFV
jgi:hypothetical protein